MLDSYIQTQFNKSHLCTLHLGNEPTLLEFQPVGFIQLRPDEEVEVSDFVVFSHECGSEPKLTVRLHDHQNSTEHLSGDELYFCLRRHRMACDQSSDGIRNLFVQQYAFLAFGCFSSFFKYKKNENLDQISP